MPMISPRLASLLCCFSLGVFVALVVCPLPPAFGQESHSPNKGPLNHALQLDGINDFVLIPHNNAYNLTHYTIEFWFHPLLNEIPDTPGQSDLVGLYWKTGTTDPNQEPRAPAISLIGRRELDERTPPYVLATGINWEGGFGGPATGPIIFPDQWYHTAFVVDGTSLLVYLDGILSASMVIPNEVLSNTSAIFLGKVSLVSIPTRFFEGQIDELRIWNKARSGTEIHQDLSKRLTGSEPGLVGYWSFDEGSGQFVFDESPTGNNGTLGGDSIPATDDPSWVLSTWNAPPSSPTVDVTPDDPDTLDDLICTATGSVDPEGQAVTLRFEWFRDGEPVGNETDFLSHMLTARDQTIECVVTPNDGIQDGPSGRDEVVIQNSPPSLPVVKILPEDPTPDDGLAVPIILDSTDDDDDFILYVYEWYESSDGENWMRRSELSGSFEPFAQGQPEISHLFTQIAEHWRIDVTPVDFPVGKGHLPAEHQKGSPPPDRATDSVFILPSLNDDGTVDSKDMIELFSVYRLQNQHLSGEIKDRLFEVGRDSDTATVGFVQLLEVSNSWYEHVSE